MNKNEFNKYATKHKGISSLNLHKYYQAVQSSYISPTIIEERQLNVAQMDVFSRLMMDRIIFLGLGGWCEQDKTEAKIRSKYVLLFHDALICLEVLGKLCGSFFECIFYSFL